MGKAAPTEYSPKGRGGGELQHLIIDLALYQVFQMMGKTPPAEDNPKGEKNVALDPKSAGVVSPV